MDNALAAEQLRDAAAEPAPWKEAVAALTEARLHQLVAARLGINATQVRPDAALVDDLGADEVDLLEIAVALEEEFGFAVPDAVLSRVRTYGDLSRALTVLLDGLPDSDVAQLLVSGSVRVRVICNAADEVGTMLRAARLTRQVIDGIVEDVLGTAGVTRLELTCSWDTSDSQLARIVQQLAWLRNRGVEVSVQRLGQDRAARCAVTCHAHEDTLSQPEGGYVSAEADSPACAGGMRPAE